MDFCVQILVSCFMEVYLPPTQYDHEPKVHYEVVAMSSDELQDACWVPRGSWVWACVGPAYIPTIYYDETLTGEALKVILRHEKAHINGWPNTHPQ